MTTDYINPDIDAHLEELRQAGNNLGGMYGRYLAARQTFNQAFTDAAHAELQMAGLCTCDDEPAPAPKPLTPEEVGQRISAAFAQINEGVRNHLAKQAAEANRDGAGEPVQADEADTPTPTTWCGNPDHDDPCNNCEAILIDASHALRQRIPTGEQ